jgi:hypothetical protein
MRIAGRVAVPVTVVALAAGLITDGSSARAATSCIQPHCYAVLGKSFSPGATKVWTNLKTYCMTLDGTAGGFDNNEVWAIAPGSGNYVEFGHTRNTLPGVPTLHWFWARTNNGIQQGFDLSASYANLTVYNATIRWTGSSGLWEFYQGGARYGNGGGNYPVGPIVTADLGTEMGSSTTTPQNSIYDFNSGRTQSGVDYSTWSNPPRIVHDVPPFDPNGSYGDTWISDDNPSTGGVFGC